MIRVALAWSDKLTPAQISDLNALLARTPNPTALEADAALFGGSVVRPGGTQRVPSSQAGVSLCRTRWKRGWMPQASCILTLPETPRSKEAGSATEWRPHTTTKVALQQPGRFSRARSPSMATSSLGEPAPFSHMVSQPCPGPG
jgi:hypothetical protein